MRKLLIFVAAMMITVNLLAGGLVTNSNQSAMFTRLQNRNASTSIDAVYYNPAGLTKLGNGFFASINNQTVGQTKTVITDFPWISGVPKEYIGDVSAPVYPGVYLAYNTGKLSFSAGFNPIGGGGGAEYKTGLPSFETPISSLPPSLRGQGIPTTAYAADIYFEGTSVYFGYQVNAAYKVSEQISVGLGLRYVSAKNTYNGYLRNIQINPTYTGFGPQYTGSMVSASGFFTDGSTVLNTLSTGSASAATALTTLIGGGTPAATPLTALPTATQTQIATLLGAAGISTTGMNIGTAAATLNAVAPNFAAKSAAMASYAAQTKDVEVDAEQTGSGVSPILSVNYSPSDKMNFSARYEFRTNLEMTTSLIDNKGGGFFTEGEKTIADMPALLALGAEVKPIDKLSLAATFNTYMDKKIDYDGSDKKNIAQIDKNFVEYGLGAEYSISDKLRASLGWVATSTGVLPAYQSDQRYSTNTDSWGAGFGYRVNSMIDVNIGGQYTFYDNDVQTYAYPSPASPLVKYNQSYKKKTWIIGVGVDLYFGKTE